MFNYSKCPIRQILRKYKTRNFCRGFDIITTFVRKSRKNMVETRFGLGCVWRRFLACSEEFKLNSGFPPVIRLQNLGLFLYVWKTLLKTELSVPLNVYKRRCHCSSLLRNWAIYYLNHCIVGVNLFSAMLCKNLHFNLQKQIVRPSDTK